MNLGKLLDEHRPPVDRGSSLLQQTYQPGSWGYYAVRVHTLGEIVVSESELIAARNRERAEYKREWRAKKLEDAKVKQWVAYPARPTLQPPVSPPPQPRPGEVECLVETADHRFMIFSISEVQAKAMLADPGAKSYGFAVLAVDVKKQ
jgi:hypothetical protein